MVEETDEQLVFDEMTEYTDEQWDALKQRFAERIHHNEDGTITVDPPLAKGEEVSVAFEGDTTKPKRKAKPQPKYLVQHAGLNRTAKRRARKIQARNMYERMVSELGKQGRLAPEPPQANPKRKPKQHGRQRKAARRRKEQARG